MANREWNVTLLSAKLIAEERYIDDIDEKVELVMAAWGSSRSRCLVRYEGMDNFSSPGFATSSLPRPH